MLVEEPRLEETRIKEALKKFWGFEGLRALQSEVVTAALKNRDAVVIMPTGGGKSLCFQLPAVVTESLTVVVSPLIALMKDQVDALNVVGVPAAALNSSLSPQEEEAVRRKVANGELRLLYLSPERLLQNATLQMLARAYEGRGVARFAIDEAHCISAWGHDFRPEFRLLRRIKETFPGVPVQAFTATATPKVQRDIAIQLQLERPLRFIGVFDRPSLTYRIVAKDDPVRRTAEAVRRYPDEGVIVYCLSRKDTEAVANALAVQGIPAVAYHAGLSSDVRKKVSEDFAQEKVNIVVATIAFGMGIDRANVRCVIHECLPKSMEGYQQETGRAGRDGLPGECILLYSHGDVVRLKRLLRDGDQETVAHHHRLLEEVNRFATSRQCRHQFLSEYFGQPYEADSEGCGACDVCLGDMQPLGIGRRRGRSAESEIENMDRELFEKLRSWRRSVAAERNVPAYVVLHDATLMRIAAIRPSTVMGFRSISGMGVRRAEEFGADLAALVADHVSATGATLDQPLTVATAPALSPIVSPRTATYYAYFRQGLSVEEVANKVGFKPGTIWGHLVTFIESEKPASIDAWVDPAVQAQVAEALAAVDSEMLRPVYEHLGETVSYEVIRAVKAFLITVRATE